MKYKYSIIVPHYNSPQLLYKLIESIPLRDDIEIIIIDDNSSELPELSLFQQYKLSLFVNNTGIQSAGTCRNIGLKNAVGKWLLFADADDFFLPDAFEIIDRNINEEFELIFFNPTSTCLLTGNISDRHVYYENLVDRFIEFGEQNIRYDFSPPWSKVYRRDFLLNFNIQFDEVIASNDVMFSLKSGHLANTIKASRETIYCVTRGANSLTVNRDKRLIESRLSVEIKKLGYVNSYKLMATKTSLLHCLKLYWPAINLRTLRELFNWYIKGAIDLFPSTYASYIFSPKKLLQRLVNQKAKPSFLDKKYRKK